MIDITKFFYNQLNKHGDVGGHTDIREYVDAMTNSELLDMILGSDWDEEPDPNTVQLHLHMDTDDDAEISYMGDLYGLYGTNLTITRQFESREDAVRHLNSNLFVVSGGKAEDLTSTWINESIERLGNGEDADYIAGNQTYSVTIRSI
jgi:hypothetical protein